MGQLIDGVWTTSAIDTRKTDGKFIRADSSFRNWITPDGSPGPTGSGGFEAEPDRYHLYVSYACPWAHRTLIMRKLKRLEDLISVSVVDYFMGENGWEFSERDGAIPDFVNSAKTLPEIYILADPHYTGRATVPVLWDKKQNTIVSNESSEIIRMFNSAFDAWGDTTVDFYPEALRAEIDAVNPVIYSTVNNGVYKCGFATNQDVYEENVNALFDTLDAMEDRLSGRRYLAGDRITEADWRFFVTLIRFDAVYVGHFKCNRRRIDDYPNLSNYLRDLYQVPGVADTVNLLHIKRHYYQSHETVNPSRIVPVGPDLDFDRPHDRDRFDKAA